MRYHAKDTLFKAPADSLEAGDKELKKEPVPGKPAELKRQSEKKDTVSFEIITDSISLKIDKNGNIVINLESGNLHFLNQ